MRCELCGEEEDVVYIIYRDGRPHPIGIKHLTGEPRLIAILTQETLKQCAMCGEIKACLPSGVCRTCVKNLALSSV